MQDMKRRKHVGCEDRRLAMARKDDGPASKRTEESPEFVQLLFMSPGPSNIPQGLDRRWFYIKTRHVKKLGTDLRRQIQY